MFTLTAVTRVLAAWAAGIALLAGVAAASDATLRGPYAAQYARAHEAMTQDRVVEGATDLLEFFRALPADDIHLTETTLGHAHLLWFAATRLMWSGERHPFYFDTLQSRHLRQGRRVEDPPTDALLRHGWELTQFEYGAHMLAPGRIRRGANTEHEAVRAASLVALGYIRHYRGEYLDLPEPRMLVERHPELAFSRFLVEIPVLEAVRLARNPEQSLEYRDAHAGTLMRARRGRGGSQPGEDRSLFQYSLWGEQGGSRYFEMSPGLEAISEALPSMHTKNIDQGVIARWSERLEDGESDLAVRHFLVGMLAAASTTPAERDAARPGLEAVAALPPATADVLLARISLIRFARAEHDAHDMFERVRQLTALKLLPSAPDFNPYVEVLEIARMASEYFLHYGHIGLAIGTHEACAAMFPGTPVALAESRRADLLTEEGARISIDRVNMLIDTYMHNAQQSVRSGPRAVQEWRDYAQAMLEDIVEHSPHGGVRDAMTARLERLDDVIPSPPPSPPRDSILAAWNRSFAFERSARSAEMYHRHGPVRTFSDLVHLHSGN